MQQCPSQGAGLGADVSDLSRGVCSDLERLKRGQKCGSWLACDCGVSVTSALDVTPSSQASQLPHSDLRDAIYYFSSNHCRGPGVNEGTSSVCAVFTAWKISSCLPLRTKIHGLPWPFS